MKHAVLVIFSTLLVAAVGFAQQAPQTSPSAPPPPPVPMHHMRCMPAMSADHAQMMKDHVAKLRATLEEMKTNTLELKTPALKKQAQLEIQLWQGMVEHMEAMAEMSAAPGPSPSTDMPAMPGSHHGMSCGREMKGGPEGGCCGQTKNGVNAGCCADMKAEKACCNSMERNAGCCGGNKCMQPTVPANPGD